MSDKADEPIDVDLVAAQFEALDSDTHRKALLEAIRARDVYRRRMDELREQVRKLELGLLGPKKQRFKGESDEQLSLTLLSELLGRQLDDEADVKELAEALAREAEDDAVAHAGDGGDGDDGSGSEVVHRRKRKPTGRKTRRALPKVTVEMMPDEVERLGTDAFECIGAERSTTIERRVSSLVEVTVVRKKYRAKTPEAIEAVKAARAESGVSTGVEQPSSWITIAPPPELPIERGIAGPGLLANVVVRRFADYLPYHRLENVYEREGMRIGRSTLYGWMEALHVLFSPLTRAMLLDAKTAPYLCADATGVLVLAPEKCSRGHFWVLVAPERHVLFNFTERHDAKAADELLADYTGYTVLDAHSVYDHLFGEAGATEVACWGHARAYFFKTIGSEPKVARTFLENLRLLFLLERRFADKPRKQRERMRVKKVKPLVDRHFELCRKHDDTALDGTPLRAAVTYSLNQEKALRRFLSDGRLPATNNISERELRRQATGRKNWLFVGSNDGGAVNATMTSLIASCQLHDIEPETYLRDLLCLIPSWPKSRVLELAPCNWEQTRQHPETQRRLEANNFRYAVQLLDKHDPRTA